jgi:hypothetical protein
MNITVFWDVTPCGSFKNRRVLQLLVTANVVTISLIFVTLMMRYIPRNDFSYKSHTA